MANQAALSELENSDSTEIAALQHRNWRRPFSLSSSFYATLRKAEHFLAAAGFDRAPWLAVLLALGIALWFILPGPFQWLAVTSTALAIALGAAAALRPDGAFPFVRQALIAMGLMLAAGCMLVWVKSALVGAAPIDRLMVTKLSGMVLAREEQSAEARIRLTLQTREPGGSRMIRVRLNLPQANDLPGLVPGAKVRLRARLVPPAPPMLPGGHDFARTAWFKGLSATGSVLGKVVVEEAGASGMGIAAVQERLSSHVRAQLPGSAGALAAAFASGDRGGIAEVDEEAMRDAGLSHLLSISGLHVSAVIGATYFLAIRLLALWPWLALRVRLPLLAAGMGAVAGIAYTLLSGAEVPTIRSCIGAMLVLAALVLGREPLSMRMLAVAAFVILLVWPESVVSAGFQMSFTSVIAIIALHDCAPVRAFLAPREEGWMGRGARRLVMLIATGVVIEAALMPIGLYHFNKAGVYGALANVLAIPLTTFVSMPTIALALLFDLAGAGAPFWWLSGKSLDAMLLLAHWTAGRPGAVTSLPSMGLMPIMLFVAGGLWLALWRGKARLWGLALVPVSVLLMAQSPVPDILVSGDGRHVGVADQASGQVLFLRESRSSYARDNLLAQAGLGDKAESMEDWPGAQCNPEFCQLAVEREGRTWLVLMTRNRERVPERALAAACERVDLVISDRWLPRSCRPRWFKADKALLERTGGLAIDLRRGKVATVAQGQGKHGWWITKPAYTRFAPPVSPKAEPGTPAQSTARLPAGLPAQ